VVADLLYKRFPHEAEGALAQRLSELVRRETLGDVGTTLGLGRYLRLAKGEEAAGERQNPALLANACEAVFGALYLDGGLSVARRLIEAHWMPLIEAERRPPRDAKTALQEWAQGHRLPLPAYTEIAREGPDHEPHFTVEVVVEDKGAARGEGRSKRLAEQAAAERLLARFRTGDGADA
jgi:ribonuclease-3